LLTHYRTSMDVMWRPMKSLYVTRN